MVVLVASLIAVLASYLAGSIPFGWLIARAVAGVDIREHGSGNIGATNVARTLGKTWGVIVLVLDALKGIVPTLVLPFLVQVIAGGWKSEVQRMTTPVLTVRAGSESPPKRMPDGAFLLESEATVEMEAFMFSLVRDPAGANPFADWHLPVLCGLAAITGHMFPVWLRFRGGKGGATGLGVGIVLAPQAMAVGFGVWVIVVSVTRYVSLGTMLAAMTVAGAHFALAGNPFDSKRISLSLFVLFAAVLIVVRHRSNLARIARGTEPKLSFRRTPTEEEPPAAETGH